MQELSRDFSCLVGRRWYDGDAVDVVLQEVFIIKGFMMKSLAVMCVVLGVFVSGCSNFDFEAVRWESLFNGQDLSGWHVACHEADQSKAFWTVADGAIVCDSLGKPKHNYVWLISDGEYDNFKLQLKFQVYKSSKGNSGVQVRSRYDTAATAPGGGWLDGPQVDIHPPMPGRCGLIYDETRGVNRWIYPSRPNWEISLETMPEAARQTSLVYADDDPTAWNTMEIECMGTIIKTSVNGHGVADFDGAGLLDDEVHQKHNVGLNGHIALQLHSGDQVLIRYKDIKLRRL